MRRHALLATLCLTAALALNGCGGEEAPPAPGAAPAPAEARETAPAREEAAAKLETLPEDTAEGSVAFLGNTLPVATALAVWTPRTRTLQVELYATALTPEQRAAAIGHGPLRELLQKAGAPAGDGWGPATPYAALIMRFAEDATGYTLDTLQDLRVAVYNFQPGDTPSASQFYIKDLAAFLSRFGVNGLEEGSRIRIEARTTDPGERIPAVDVRIDTAIIAVR